MTNANMNLTEILHAFINNENLNEKVPKRKEKNERKRRQRERKMKMIILKW